MQLLLILGILFALAAVSFALQNNMNITVSFLLWSFESQLAMVLIGAIGAGALIASLVSTPTVISSQGNARRLRRRLDEMEERNRALERRVRELDHLPPMAEDLPPQAVDAQSSPRMGLRSALLDRQRLH